MKKTYLFLVALTISLVLTASTTVVCAGSGCCSRHGGVNCSAGRDTDGSVICNDGWRDSSCDYISSCPLSNKHNSGGSGSNNTTKSNNSSESNGSIFGFILMMLTSIFGYIVVLPFLLSIVFRAFLLAIGAINTVVKLFINWILGASKPTPNPPAPTSGTSAPPISSGPANGSPEMMPYPSHKPVKMCPKCGSPMYKRYTSKGTILFCRKTKQCGYCDYSSYGGERPK